MIASLRLERAAILLDRTMPWSPPCSARHRRNPLAVRSDLDSDATLDLWIAWLAARHEANNVIYYGSHTTYERQGTDR